jgi:hypothetical protein
MLRLKLKKLKFSQKSSKNFKSLFFIILLNLCGIKQKPLTSDQRHKRIIISLKFFTSASTYHYVYVSTCCLRTRKLFNYRAFIPHQTQLVNYFMQKLIFDSLIIEILFNNKEIFHFMKSLQP